MLKGLATFVGYITLGAMGALFVGTKLGRVQGSGEMKINFRRNSEDS